MSEKMHHEPDVALTETEARQVLERAAQSEIRGDTLTVAELTRVAQEAGFSPEYVDRAIAEILEARSVVASPRSVPESIEEEDERPGSFFARVKGWVRPVKAALAGGIIGALARISVAPGAPTQMIGPFRVVQGFAVSLGLLVAGSIILAALHRRTRSFERMQVQILSLWAGFVLGWTALTGAFDPRVTTIAGMFWFLSAVVGGAIVNFANHESPEPGNRTGAP